MKTLAPVKMLDIFLNYACQAKCAFCYNPPLTPELIAWKLPLEKLAAELVQGRDGGYKGVTFSGGEVTLLKDLSKMLRLSRKAGFQEIGIITNGLLMAEASYTQELLDAGLSFVCISVHGAEAALHDKMVKVEGAFAKVLKTLDLLEAAKIPVVLNFVLTQENAHGAADFVRHFAGRPGVVEFQLYYPHYDGLMAVHRDALRLPMTKAAEVAVEALAASDKAWLYNIPPCLAPDLAPRMRNWQEEEDSLLIDPAGVSEGGFSQERRDRHKTAVCRNCRFDAQCLGFEKKYVELYGDDEMQAVVA
jgi:MoaA/NifB/PqqE/SkfB family radical SAM enzyme